MASPSNKKNVFDISASDLKTFKKRLENNSERIIRKQYGVGKDELAISDRSKKLFSKINASANALIDLQLSSGSERNLNGFDSMLDVASRSFNVANTKNAKEHQKAIEALKKELITINSSYTNEIVLGNKSKQQERIATYNMILKLIPKMRMVIKTYVASIISPDDFTKNSLLVHIDEALVNKEKISEVKNNIDKILDEFDLNANIVNDITTYIKDGALYFGVYSLHKEITRLLREDTSLDEDTAYSTLLENTNYIKLSEDSTLIPRNEEMLLESGNWQENPGISDHSKTILNEFTTLFENKDSKLSLKDKISNLDRFINETFIIGSSKNLVLEDKLLKGTIKPTSNSNMELNSLFNRNTSVNTMNGNIVSDDGFKALDKFKFNSKDKPIVKRISMSNIVPLTYEKQNLGYLLLDIVDVDSDNTVLPTDVENNNIGTDTNPLASNASASMNSNLINGIISSGKDIPVGNGVNNIENSNGTGLDAIEKARLMFIANVFANKLSLQSNLRLIKKNETLKQAIYNSLAIKKILNKDQKIRVIYLEPHEVVEINRGHSIFDNVLFFCKLYIANILTATMEQSLAGSPQQAVYVEVGLDNSPMGVVQQTIRDIKSKEIGSIHSMDLNTILNKVGTQQKYFIPVVDGEKPISFESIDNPTPTALDNDFLKFLSDNIFSGMGTPAAFIGESDNIEFAKTLSMQNGRYLRDVLIEQIPLSKGYTDVIRRIYGIWFNSDNENNHRSTYKSKNSNKYDEQNSNYQINLEAINITFPAPANLGLNTYSEQLQSAGNVIESIINNFDLKKYGVDDDSLDMITNRVKGRLLKKFTPILDWNEIDDIIVDVIRENTSIAIKDKLKEKMKSDGPGETETAMDGDMSSEENDGGDLSSDVTSGDPSEGHDDSDIPTM